MRFMGVDYGSKRVGIAISDQGARIAFPKGTLKNEGLGALIKDLKRLVAAEEIVKIIIGLPLGLGGQETKESAAVRGFAEKLKAELGLPIVFENEMLTTRMAEAAGGRKELNDASAAALILQSYLDKKSG